MAWTVAVLEYVQGTALCDVATADAARAGVLLADLHRALTSHDVPRVPGQTLDFFAARARQWQQTAAAQAVEDLWALTRQGALPWGVVYGDPSPEVLVEPSGALAVIDWGTPSRGPLVYDVAAWAGHVARVAERPDLARGAFVDAYRARMGAEIPQEALAAGHVLWCSLLSEAG